MNEDRFPGLLTHTPGPWEVRLHTNGWHVVGEPIPDSFLPDRRKQIVFVGHMREADAHLIAAAPDLLQAVKDAKVGLIASMKHGLAACDPTRETMCFVCEALVSIESALAKVGVELKEVSKVRAPHSWGAKDRCVWCHIKWRSEMGSEPCEAAPLINKSP